MLTHKRLMELAAYAASPEHQAEIAALDALIKAVDTHYAKLEERMKRNGTWGRSLNVIIVDVPEADNEEYPAAAR